MKPPSYFMAPVITRERRGWQSTLWNILRAAVPAASAGLAAACGALAMRHGAGPHIVALLVVGTAMAMVLRGALGPMLGGADLLAALPPGAAGPRLLAMEGSSGTPAFPHGNGGIFTDTSAGEPAPPDRLEPECLPVDWLAGTCAAQQGLIAQGLHRALDIGASLALLALTLPLLILVAVAIRIDSAGPILYRQERVGRHGRVFTILKFRSMRADAEAPGQAVWAAVGDPRVTRVGRFLRLTRIDEIPQAVNVLRGDMAFVGPRPERPAFVAQLEAMIPHYRDRALVRPGLTGWAQVRLAYGASVDDARDKLSYDLYYVQQRSIWFDLRIILATVRVVLHQAGAR